MWKCDSRAVADDRCPRSHLPGLHESIDHVRISTSEVLDRTRVANSEKQHGLVGWLQKCSGKKKLAPLVRLAGVADVHGPELTPALQIIFGDVIDQEEVHSTSGRWRRRRRALIGTPLEEVEVSLDQFLIVGSIS